MHVRIAVIAVSAAALWAAVPPRAMADTAAVPAVGPCTGQLDRPLTPAFYARCLAPGTPVDTPAPQPLPTPAVAAPSAGARTPPPIPSGALRFISFPPVHFVTGKAELSAGDKRTLDYVAAALRGWSGKGRLLIVGYADSRGTVAYNEALSARRAAAVAQYIQDLGVLPEAITQSAKGAREPIDQPWTTAGRAHDRRVELYAVLR